MMITREGLAGLELDQRLDRGPKGWERKRLADAGPAGQGSRPCTHHLRLHLSC